MENFNLIWAKFSETAIIPSKRESDAGFDLYVDCKGDINLHSIGIQPNSTVRFDTNIGVVIPKGYVGIVKERSSTGKLSMFVGAGIIDEGYRGQIGVFITNTSNEHIYLPVSKAVAQMIVVKCEHSNSENIFYGTPEEFANKYPSERGLGKEGSSGK